MSSTRTLELTVQNDTGIQLSLDSEKLTHGKWLDMPANNIASGASNTWKAGNKEAALIGTAGKVVYKGGADTFEIDFDKPYGSSATVVTHNATGHYDSKLENDNLQHHHSSCTIVFYRVA